MREKRIEDKARARLFCARLMAVILAAGIAAAAVTGCGVKQEEPDDGKLKIVTTIFPQYDFVRAIAGGTGAVNVRMLLSPGEEVSRRYRTVIFSSMSALRTMCGWTGSLRTWGTRDPRRCDWWI